MKALDLANKSKSVALNYRTLYIMGCFGAPMNATNKKRYTNNHSYNKQSARTAKINAATADTFGFDCVCLLKGLMWGWDGNVNKTYGGAVYASNGVPDVGADTMYKTYCTNQSTDFSKIEVGEFVWMPGHIGIYIGDGLVVECTPIWKDGVQITAVGNIGKKAGYNTRTWTGHGKCKFLDYTKEEPAPAPQPEPTPEPTPAPSTDIQPGDMVKVTGHGSLASDKYKPVTRKFADHTMKVIDVVDKSRPCPLALNQYGQGVANINGANKNRSGTTAWFRLEDVKKI